MTRLYMFDIGQGDSFFIETKNGKQLLIDGGKDASVLGELAKVMPWYDKTIDVVIATHPDADHIGGLLDVVKRYKVGTFITSEVVGDTDLFKDLMNEIKNKKISSYYAFAGMKISFSETEYFEILFPDRDVSLWETNNASIVGKFVVGDRSALFTGDSPVWVEQYLVAKNPPAGGPNKLNVDILKLGHHGSRTSTSAAYLKATTPNLALISAGKNNSYGHPNKEVIDLLNQFKIPTLSTQTEGTVLLETDGVKWYRR